MRNVSEKNSREIRNTHFMFNIFFYENRAVCAFSLQKCFQERISMSRYAHVACVANSYDRQQQHVDARNIEEAALLETRN